MTEPEWLACATKPSAMLTYVVAPRKGALPLAPRKLRQLSCGFCRLLDAHLTDARSRQALAVLERNAHAAVSEAEYLLACEGAWAAEDAWVRNTDTSGGAWTPDGLGFAAVCAVAAAANTNTNAGVTRSLWYVLEGVARTAGAGQKVRARTVVSARVCDLIREVVGNPFRAWATLPAWLGVGLVQPDGVTVTLSDTARELAAAIEARSNYADLPILADALEECGLSDAAFLAHCRRPEGHGRGCWALELALGRG